jgi:hypothetical protein
LNHSAGSRTSASAAKAQTIASVLLKSAAKALLAMNRTRATRDAKLSKPEF